MKLRYPIILCIALEIAIIITDNMGFKAITIRDTLGEILGLAIGATILYAVYVFIKWILKRKTTQEDR